VPPGPADAASILERARATRDDLAARLLLAAAVQRAGQAVGARVVLNGGAAVDFYASGALGTSAAYPAAWRASSDVDVVVIAVDPLREAWVPLLRELEKLGLRPRWIAGTARVVEVPDLPYVLEVVGDELGKGRGERPITVLLDGEIPLTVRSPEDVILAYAESGWHLRHSGDWTRALAVSAAMRERLDLAYLREESLRRGQLDVVERVLQGEPMRRLTF
jgi:hypothetical protein